MNREITRRLQRLEQETKAVSMGVRHVISDTRPRGRPGEDAGDEDLILEGCSIHRRGAAVYVISDRLPTEEEWERERCTPF